MAGTKIGAIKARDKNLAKDPEFYSKIGSVGGKNGVGTLKGFAACPERAKTAGSLGGKHSKRGRIYDRETKTWEKKHE